VLSLLLLVVLFWVLSTLLLAASTLFLQGYFNETPPSLREVLVRGLMAGSAATAVVALWTFLCYRSPERFGPVTEFTAAEEQPYYPRLWTLENGEYTEYKRKYDTQMRPVYVDTVRERTLPRRPTEIIVMDGDKRVSFKQVGEEGGRGLRYRDDQGRYMEEGFLGQPVIPHPGRTFVYVLLNLLHGAVWLVCFWPLLRFSPGQAVVLSLGTWVAMTLFFLPPILNHAGKLAEAKKAQQTSGGESWAGLPPRRDVSCRWSSDQRAATAAVLKSTWVSAPAVTPTRSVRICVLPSTTNSAWIV
jgi:hypothetical protein